MVAIPMMKLFSMTIKTLAKPMAKRIKTEAQKHPTFRGVLNTMGQATNNISARISIRMAGHTTTKIKPLEEDKAIADGGDLLAEGFIYGLGTFLMVFEYMSSAKEKEAKEAKAKVKKEQEKRELAQALEDINNRLAKLETLDQGGVLAKDGKSAPSGGESKVLGLSLSAMPAWGRRRFSPARTRSERDLVQVRRDGPSITEPPSPRNEAANGGSSAAKGGSGGSVELSSGSCTRSVLKGIEGSIGERGDIATATGGAATAAGETSYNPVVPSSCTVALIARRCGMRVDKRRCD
eukprot:g9569.t1